MQCVERYQILRRGALAYPSPVDNSLVVIPNGIYVMETSRAIRGNLSGIGVTPQEVIDKIKQATVFENFPGADGRSFISVHKGVSDRWSVSKHILRYAGVYGYHWSVEISHGT